MAQALTDKEMKVTLSFWFFLLLHIATAGFYTLYWLYSLAETINERAGRTLVSTGRIIVSIFLYTGLGPGAGMVYSGFSVYGLSESMILFSYGTVMDGLLVWAFGIASFILYLTVVFQAASVLSAVSEHDAQWRFKGLWLVLFHCFYLYFILRNKAADAPPKTWKEY